MLVVIFGVVYTSQEFERFFKPRSENIERETFEETKSYVHAQEKELSRLYLQYESTETSEEDKLIIKNVIIQNFGNFDETKLQNEKLRNFLIKVRGY